MPPAAAAVLGSRRLFRHREAGATARGAGDLDRDRSNRAGRLTDEQRQDSATREDGRAGDEEAARAVRVRPDPVHRDRRCALRAPSHVRQRGRCRGAGSARALRGRRPVRAGRPLAAVAAHRADVRAREPQARLLPLHGVPDRALARQQRHQPPPRSARAKRVVDDKGVDWLGLLEQEPDAGSRERRARPPRGVLPRLDGHDAAPGHGLRAALRVRHLPADDPGRLAARAAGQLAAAARSVGGRPAAGAGGGQARLLVRGARRQPGRGRRPAIEPARPPVRSPGGGLRRQDHQHAPALGRRGARCLRLPGVQRRRVRERAGRAAHGRIPDAGPLSRRLHEHGAGLRFVQEYFLVACSLADLVRRFRRSNADWSALPDKVAIQLNDTHPAWRCPS